jgi:hypothetical protein
VENGVAELVQQALAVARPADGQPDWDAYATLLWRASVDGSGALRIGLGLLTSAAPAERTAGCDLLGHASDRNEAVRAATADALVALAKREAEGCVLAALAGAVARTGDQRAVAVLAALAGHPEAGVRRQVAESFAGVLTGLPDGPDIQALIELTRDQDPRVRDWATFTLGFQAEVDSAAIRAALGERTTDEDAETREEGIRGLARRHDREVIPLLTELLRDPAGAHVHTLSAARILGIPELLPALARFGPDDAEATAAAHACDPTRRAEQDASAWKLVRTLHELRPDLDAALSMPRFDYGLHLDLGAACRSTGYDVERLLLRADGDPLRAAELVAADVPREGRASTHA